MNCKDCFHYDVCKIIDFKMEYYNKSQLECETEMCDKFQDKSKLIELPCKIGQTIYVVDFQNYECVNKDCFCCFNATDIEQAFLRKCEYARHKPLITKIKCDSVEAIIRWQRYFEKTAFLTEEEAEAKLKELNR